MAITVKLGNASRTTSRTPEVSSDNKLKFSRQFYQFLGSVVKNKQLLDDYNNDKLSLEYKRFLDEMNDLFIVVNYPELSSGIILSEHIKLLDEYLGDLGSISEYIYSKDSVNIPQWLSISKQTEYRILIDDDDNTYLTDTNGTEVLVSYTRNI